jgi:nucleoside-diphosphate-sugar epimerase
MAPTCNRLLIVGGKTRLAQALHAQASQRGSAVRVWCRSGAEQAALRALYPAADLLVADDAAAGHQQPDAALCVVVCALGVVHPARPDWAHQLDALARDTATLATLLAQQASAPHLVLVSSVLALLPPRDRRHYAGFKNLAEASCATALGQAGGTRLSVVYPGRLVETRRGGPPAAWLATPYTALARRLLQIADGQQPLSQVVGLDARALLLAGLPRLLASALWPRLPELPLALRDQPRLRGKAPPSDPTPHQPTPQVPR